MVYRLSPGKMQLQTITIQVVRNKNSHNFTIFTHEVFNEKKNI